MNQLFSGIIDRYALYQLHKEKSTISHFYSEKMQYLKADDYLSFYKEPNIPEVNLIQKDTFKNYTLGRYCFASEIKNNGDSNKNVIGIYRKNLDNKNSASVIFVHGWRMNSTNKIDAIYLQRFMELGYNMYYFTMPYHFGRNSADSLYNGELMVSSNINRTLISVQQAVSDLRALIKWVKSTYDGKVILIGVSLGGFLTNLTSAIESNIDALISVFYANSLAYSIWNTIPGKYIKEDFLKNSFTYDDLKESWKIITPNMFKPAIPKEKILLLSAIHDKYVDINDAEYLWKEWGSPKRVLYKCGHAGIVLFKERIANDSLDFVGKTV